MPCVVCGWLLDMTSNPLVGVVAALCRFVAALYSFVRRVLLLLYAGLLLLCAALYAAYRSATQGTAGVGFFTVFQWRLSHAIRSIL